MKDTRSFLTVAVLALLVFIVSNLPTLGAPKDERPENNPFHAVELLSTQMEGVEKSVADLEAANEKLVEQIAAQKKTIVVLEGKISDLETGPILGDDCPNVIVPGADLRNCDMRFNNLAEANLEKSDLRGANLMGMAFSKKANMAGADLTGANLRGATGTLILTGANLTKADLRNAVLKVKMDRVIWNDTTCPDGTNSEDDDGDGFTCLNNFRDKPLPKPIPKPEEIK